MDMDYGPVDFLRRIPRASWNDLGLDDGMLSFMLSAGIDIGVRRDVTELLELDDVPELSVKAEGQTTSTELSFSTRDSVDASDLLLVGLQSGRRLVVGWHSIHRGSLERNGESTTPRREGAPVKYVFKQALPPLDAVILY